MLLNDDFEKIFYKKIKSQMDECKRLEEEINQLIIEKNLYLNKILIIFILKIKIERDTER